MLPWKLRTQNVVCPPTPGPQHQSTTWTGNRWQDVLVPWKRVLTGRGVVKVTGRRCTEPKKDGEVTGSEARHRRLYKSQSAAKPRKRPKGVRGKTPRVQAAPRAEPSPAPTHVLPVTTQPKCWTCGIEGKDFPRCKVNGCPMYLCGGALCLTRHTAFHVLARRGGDDSVDTGGL